MLQPQKKNILSSMRALRAISRSFSTFTQDDDDYRGSATVENRERETARKMREKGLEKANTGPAKFVNNTLQNMHIRYVPKKKLNFNLQTPDGKVALVYETTDTRIETKASRWMYALATALPAALMAPSLVPVDYLFMVYPMLFVPTSIGLL